MAISVESNPSPAFSHNRTVRRLRIRQCSMQKIFR